METKTTKNELLAAISAAVTGYIKSQEEAQLAALAAGQMAPAAAGSFYAAYGRQQMMEMRRLLSFRMVRR